MFRKGDLVLKDRTGRPLFRVESDPIEAFALVCKVTRVHDEVVCILKTLHPHQLQRQDLKESFSTELKNWLTLSSPGHRHIARALRPFQEGDQEFILIEYIDGLNLAELVRREGRLCCRQALLYARQFCEGMIYCEMRLEGFTHRDIKPGNIMIDRRNVLKIIDFGLSSSIGLSSSMSEVAAGSEYYMAPELFGSSPDYGMASDLYAFGLTLAIMLTGKKALEIRRSPEVALPTSAGFSPLRQIILRMLDDKPERRHSDFRELLQDLQNVLDQQAHKIEDGVLCCRGCGYSSLKQQAGCPICGGRLDLDDFITIPAGPVWQGCTPDEARELEEAYSLGPGALQGFVCRQEIYLDEYRIHSCTVTNQDYLAFVQATGHPPPPHWQERSIPFSPGFERHPVVNVSLHDALAYCAWRSQSRGRAVRLPTPEEWEKAARGPGGFLYPWGATFDPARCNSDRSLGLCTAPVDAYPEGVSPFGIFNMAGNTYEWVETGEHFKELRGGSWEPPAELAGRAYLALIHGGVEAQHRGFGCRLAMSSGDAGSRDQAEIVIGGHKLIHIPGACSFAMGCPQAEAASTSRLLERYNFVAATYLERHAVAHVEVRPFYLGQFALTNEQYAAFLERSGHEPPPHWLDPGEFSRGELARHPVHNLSGNDIHAYCRWFGETYKATLRLPTAAEWEWAARGRDGRLYPWGSVFEQHRCHGMESIQGIQTSPVNSHGRGVSPYGLFNLCGNVFEWVYDPYTGHAGVRGGAWNASCEIYGLTFFHVVADPGVKRDNIGFRIAADR